MAKAHQKKKNKKINRYVNPISVPAKNKIKINQDDPRNNSSYKNKIGQTYEIIEETELDYLNEVDDYDYLWNEDNDPSAYLDDNQDLEIPTPEETMQEFPLDFSISAPTNLYIDPNSFMLEDKDSNSDGVVRWTAYLYFDDVAGAESYEYTINARTT
jgi:hypothetical protein